MSMETVQVQRMRSVPTEVVCVWMIVYIDGCICNVHLPVVTYSMCARCLSGSGALGTRQYTLNGCLCVCGCVYVCVRYSTQGDEGGGGIRRRASSALAVAGKELVEQQLERRVLGHGVVFAQVVAAGRAGVHLGSERPLQASLAGREAAIQQRCGCFLGMRW